MSIQLPGQAWLVTTMQGMAMNDAPLGASPPPPPPPGSFFPVNNGLLFEGNVSFLLLGLD